jgi:hypothetical protein
MRKYSIYIVWAALVFLCGCETVGAFGTGRITSSDVAYITHAGTLGKQTTPVNVDSITADEEQVAESVGSSRMMRPARGIKRTNAWLEDNLW